MEQITPDTNAVSVTANPAPAAGQGTPDTNAVPVTANPVPAAGPSVPAYPPPGYACPPLQPGYGGYPPQTATQYGGYQAPPPGYAYSPLQPGYGGYPPQTAAQYGGYQAPPPGYEYPPLQPGYGGYPSQTAAQYGGYQASPPGYAYPPQQSGYGYPSQPEYGQPPLQQPPKKSELGRRLRAGLLEVALYGLRIVVSNALSDSDEDGSICDWVEECDLQDESMAFRSDRAGSLK